MVSKSISNALERRNAIGNFVTVLDEIELQLKPVIDDLLKQKKSLTAIDRDGVVLVESGELRHGYIIKYTELGFERCDTTGKLFHYPETRERKAFDSTEKFAEYLIGECRVKQDSLLSNIIHRADDEITDYHHYKNITDALKGDATSEESAQQ